MKTTVAACAAAILTCASLITYTDGSTAFASPAGCGGGGHPTGTRQASTGGLHFGRDTDRWGPGLSQTQPGDIGDLGSGFIHMQCPCDVVRDPFNKHIIGGNPENLEGKLVQGVKDERAFDAGHGLLDNTFAQESNLMRGVWGNDFDPARPGSR
jgi:hypothetical protein